MILLDFQFEGSSTSIMYLLPKTSRGTNFVMLLVNEVDEKAVTRIPNVLAYPIHDLKTLQTCY